VAKQKFYNGSSWEVIGSDAAKVDIVDSEELIEATEVEGALAEIADGLLRHRLEEATYNFEQFDKDATTGMYFRFEEYRTDTTLFRKTVLSNADVNGYPQTEVQTRYDTDGTTALSTKTYTLDFDADGLLVSRDEVV